MSITVAYNWNASFVVICTVSVFIRYNTF